MAKKEIKDNIIWLSKTIEKTYGHRCPDFEKNCWCCRVWEFFDEIKNYSLPKCDFQGKCKNKAFREIYPKLSQISKNGWSYLCKKHFYQEQRRLKKINKELAWAGLKELDVIRNSVNKKFDKSEIVQEIKKARRIN